MTVLLEHIDLFTTCMEIMLGTYYSVDLMFNALPNLKLKYWVLQITHFFVKLCVLATL